MPRHTSSRERLERLQAEKAAEQREKDEKKTARKTTKASTGTRKKKAASAPGRMKIVWAVCKANGDVIETFPYPKKAEAQETAERMSAAGRADFIVKPEKVPM